MLNKNQLLKEITEGFGDYGFRDGVHYVVKNDNVYKFQTAEEGLRAWLKTLVKESLNLGAPKLWESEVTFILTECGGKLDGVDTIKLANGYCFVAKNATAAQKQIKNISRNNIFSNPIEAYKKSIKNNKESYKKKKNIKKWK